MQMSEMSVLVVDDEEFDRDIVVTALQTLGIRQIFQAGGGEEALTLLKSTHVDAIVTDIRMPGMDGPQFLRHLSEVHCASAIILLSGVNDDIQRSIGNLGRSHGLNIIGFIHKPATLDMLQRALEIAAAQQKKNKGHTNAAPVREFTPDVLREAMKQGQIHPWYQPKVDIGQLRLIGAEALARWRTTDGTLISPGMFVPEIEQAGLADELFFCMLNQVLADMRRWKANDCLFKVSVNLSMACALQLDLPEKISALLERHAVPVEQLVIEVTESQLMGDVSAALETLTRLSLLGLTLSIDDFGTGYSSLSQVAALPFTELKIDGSFVQNAGKNVKANAILDSMITLGRSLGMSVVAEGIETHDQLDFLRRSGAHVLQGYLIAKPMPANQLDSWLAEWRPGTMDHPGCQRPFAILVIDDEKTMRQIGETQFKAHFPDAVILTAANGEEALKIFGRQTIDAATVDYIMPGMDGLALLQKLRNLNPACRFVLLTADTHEATAQEATRLGALYCPKPLSESQLKRIVRFFTLNTGTI